MFKIILASPRGYCAGVDRAIGMLDDILNKYGAPIFVNHEIVHNKYIVEQFEKKGVVFTDNLDDVEPGQIMVFSAHGVAPSFVEKVKAKGIKYIDASCPLVLKVHNEAKKFINDGCEVIYIGKHTHQEAIGVADNDLEKIHIISNEEDLEKLCFPPEQKLALLNQTTLSVGDTRDLIENVQKKFPQIELPSFSDICYATTNRQNAVKNILPEIDKLIIVGSKNSSNSVKLKELGEKYKVPNSPDRITAKNSEKLNFLGKRDKKESILIDSPEDIPDGFLDDVKNLGISSGASVSQKLVQNLLDYLATKGGEFEREDILIEEKMIFPYSLELNG